MKKILVVEDDKNIVELIDIHLRDMNCELVKAYDGIDGLTKAQKTKFDLIILDLMLPRLDGIEVCRQLRGSKINTPIMMLTARTEEIDKVLGLLQQNSNEGTKAVLDFGALVVDIEKRKVTIDGKRIELSPKEFEILSLLASHPGKSYNRSRILNLVWGYEFDGFEHTVNSHINRLRAKIEPDMATPTYILTSWGVGYRFNEDL